MVTFALRRRSPVLIALLLVTSALVIVVADQRPAAADVTSVRGYACGYYTNVGLFGGPQAKLGCEPQAGQPFAPASASTLSPSVSLPPTGSAVPITATDPDGAAGKYGPAVIFGGVWPEHVGSAPPSGPITVSTQGTTGPGGSVTSSTDITLRNPPNVDSPGGFGPIPVWGDSLHVECSASETSVSGSTTFVNAFHAKATDSEGSPLPEETEPIPANPPPNYTRHGVITNVGDVFTAVYNEQIVNPDGSLTVNAVHMYLFGPVAVGDMVKGQVTCGTNPSPLPPADTRAPVCGVPVVAPMSPQDPTPKSPREELVGVFDTGGIHSVTNVQVTNGTVKVGDPASGHAYLRFTQGQTGPLRVVATRTNESQPMVWSFDVTDMAGNTTHCTGVIGHDPEDGAVGDYDGDGKTDVGVYRSSNQLWFIQNSSNGTATIVNWGSPDDVPVVGDFDGDGLADVAVFRASSGLWFIRNTSSAATGTTVVNWGASGDIPVVGDYDGDGKDDIAVYRPSNQLWFIRNSSTGAATIVNWGSPDDIAAPGDFDGDGKTDIAVFRASSGLWFIRNSSNGATTVINWGGPGDTPKVGDFDGDGKDDVAVYRSSNQLWFIRNSSTGAATIVNWGSAGDIPVVGNYDGDGRDDIAVFRATTGFFYINRSSAGLLVVNWGGSGDIPLGRPPLSGP